MLLILTYISLLLMSLNPFDRSILDRVLSSLGLLAGFRHAYFEYHSHVRLLFKLAAGLGNSWTRDGGMPVASFDGLASVLSKVEEIGAWPDGLLDAYIVMIPKTDQRSLCVLPVVYRIWLLLVWSSLRIGYALGSQPLFLVLVVASGRWRLGTLVFCTLRRCFLVLLTTKSFDTVDRSILDRVLSSLGLPGWFRHAFFEHHAHVWLHFKLASGLREPWTHDGAFLKGAH